MSFSDERIAIEKRLDDRWSTTPIAFENVPFTAPEDGLYVALDIIAGEGIQQDINSNPPPSIRGHYPSKGKRSSPPRQCNCAHLRRHHCWFF